jgi:hypothetical protein
MEQHKNDAAPFKTEFKKLKKVLFSGVFKPVSFRGPGRRNIGVR